MTYIQALNALRLQATTTRMSDRRHMKSFAALLVEHSAYEISPKAITRTRKYVREFGWV